MTGRTYRDLGWRRFSYPYVLVHLIIGLAVVVSAYSGAGAAAVASNSATRQCTAKCTTETQPEAMRGQNGEPGFAFLSDVDREGSLYCLERRIWATNDHDRLYRIKWMLDKTPLLEGDIKRLGDCTSNTIPVVDFARRDDTQIWWSRTNSRPAPSYVAPGELKTGATLIPLVSEGQVTFYHGDTRFVVAIKIVSEVERADRAFVYRYAVRTSPEVAVRLQWPEVMGPEFIEAAKRDMPGEWQVQRWSPETPLALKGRLEIAFEKRAVPVVVGAGIAVLTPGGVRWSDREVRGRFLTVVYRPR